MDIVVLAVCACVDNLIRQLAWIRFDLNQQTIHSNI